jgi:quercetin dioxygenase-like cupin family protein
MPVLPAPPDAATHDLGGARFRSIATPSRGAAETAVWQVEIAPGTPATPHQLTREEIFVVLDGRASVRLDGGAEQVAGAGDAIVVPAGVDIELANAGEAPVRMLCCLPVGGQARTADGAVFTPPWAE